MATEGSALHHLRNFPRWVFAVRRRRSIADAVAWRARIVACLAAGIFLAFFSGTLANAVDSTVAANAPIEPTVSGTEPAEATPQRLTVNEILSTRGSITFRKTPLQEVVFLLSDLWNINIVAGEKITGDVTGVFNDAPLRDVLSAILTSSGYGYTASGNSLVVLPLDEVGTGSPDFESQTLRVSVADEAEMTSTIEAAKLLLSDRGRIQPVGRSAVLVVDRKDNIDRVQAMFQAVSSGGTMSASGRVPSSEGAADRQETDDSQPGFFGATLPQIVYLTPQYTEASEMVESLQAALGDETVVAAYEAENRILVRGNQEQLNLAAQAFQQLDVARAQVRITALIYDVSLSELEELGVNWGRDFRLNSISDSPLAEFAGNIDQAVGFSSLGTGGASSLGFRTLTNNFDSTVLLRALDGSSEAKLLADPSITVVDRREASIRIVKQIPIVAQLPQQGVAVQQIEFKDAGIILRVTPRISNDNTIELKVQPEFSIQVGEVENNPIIDSRTAETTVRIANGHMFTLGGLRQKRIIESVNGVPFLRDIKYLGALFRSHETEVSESELIVFLKPELISPYDIGNERSHQAHHASMRQLDAIAYATVCPQSPYCHDRNCPNHHPRRRVNGGTPELRMLGGEGIDPLILTYPAMETGVLNGPESNLMMDHPIIVNDATEIPTQATEDTFTGYPPVHIEPMRHQ